MWMHKTTFSSKTFKRKYWLPVGLCCDYAVSLAPSHCRGSHCADSHCTTASEGEHCRRHAGGGDGYPLSLWLELQARKAQLFPTAQ